MSILTVGEISRTLNDGRPGPCRVNMGDFLQIGDDGLGRFKNPFKNVGKKLKEFHKKHKALHMKIGRWVNPILIHKRHIEMLKKLMKKRKGKKKGGGGGGEEQAEEQLTPEETEATQDSAAVAQVVAEETPQTPTAPLTVPAVPSAYYPGGLAPAIPSGASAYYQPQAPSAPAPSYAPPGYMPPSSYQMAMMQAQAGPEMEEEEAVEPGEEVVEGGGSPRPTSLPGPDLTEEIIEPEEGDADTEEVSGLGFDPMGTASTWAGQAASAASRAGQAPALTPTTKAPDITPLITAAGSALAQGLTAYQQGRAAIKQAKIEGKASAGLPQLPAQYYPMPSVQRTDDSGMPAWVPWAIGGVAALIFLPRILGR